MRSTYLLALWALTIGLTAPDARAANCSDGRSSPRPSSSYTVSGRITTACESHAGFRVRVVVDASVIQRRGRDIVDVQVPITIGTPTTGTNGTYRQTFDWCRNVSSRIPTNSLGSVESVRVELRTPDNRLLWRSPSRLLSSANSFSFDRTVPGSQFECPRQPGARPIVEIRSPADGAILQTDNCPFEACTAETPAEVFVDATAFLDEVSYEIRTPEGELLFENFFCRDDPIEGTGCRARAPDFDTVVNQSLFRRAGDYVLEVTAVDEFGQEGRDQVSFSVFDSPRTIPGTLRIDSVSTMEGSPSVPLRVGPNPKSSAATEITLEGENLHEFLEIHLAPFSPADFVTQWELYEAEIIERASDGTSLTFRMPQIPALTRTQRGDADPHASSFLARWRIVVQDRFFRPEHVLFTSIPAVQDTGAEPFRVRRPPFPLVHGFGFENEEDDPTLREFLAVYGNSAYICVGGEVLGSCVGVRVPDPFYWGIWFPIYREWIGSSDGTCVGLSASSLLFQRGELLAEDYDPDVLHPAGFTSPGKPARWDDGFSIFTGPPSPRNLWAEIRKHHGAQTSSEFIEEWLDDLVSLTSGNVRGDPVARLREIESNPSGFVSCMLRSGGGHCVTPYATRAGSGSLTDILVYDNNDPEDPSARIVIDRAQDHYNLSTSTRYEGTAITAIPLDVFRRSRTMPGLTDLPGLLLAVFGDTDAVVTTPEGRYGQMGDEFIDELPGLVPLPPLDGRGDALAGGLGLLILPPDEDEASISFSSQGGDWVFHAAQSGHFAQVAASDTSRSSEDVVDVLCEAGRLMGLRLSPENEGEKLLPRLAFARGEEERAVFRWAGLDLSSEGDYEFSMDPDNRAVRFRNESSRPTRHLLVIESVDRESGETHNQVFGPFELPAGARQETQILDWPRVTRLLSSVDVDGDGTTDETEVCEATPCGAPAEARDEDNDGLPDDCEIDLPEPSAGFRRGDLNRDSSFDLSDAVFGLSFLFQGGDAPGCLDAGDANDDGSLDISDSVFILGHLFLGGAAPPAPGSRDCGADPTIDALDCATPADDCG